MYMGLNRLKMRPPTSQVTSSALLLGQMPTHPPEAVENPDNGMRRALVFLARRIASPYYYRLRLFDPTNESKKTIKAED